MAKKMKKMENEVQATEVEQVVETTEVEATNPKKKISVKKIAFGIGAGVVAVGGAALAILSKKRHDREILEYMESCGDEGTDLPTEEDEPDSEVSETSTEE